MPEPLTQLFVAWLGRGDATLDQRERLLDELTRERPKRSFVFATCHRVELYGVGDAPGLDERARLLRGTEAVRHLFRVASGLDSLIAGEIQVLGQLRRLRDTVRGDALLERLLERALHVGRTVRATTALGSVTRSLGSLAVDEALRHVRRPQDATALVIGAGEMGKLASRALRRRVRTLLIANRSESRALALAAEIDAEYVSLDRIDDALARADVVISAADTRGALLDRPRLARRITAHVGGGPLVVVDLAVPRSVAADARGLAGLAYRTADDLRDLVAPPPTATGEAERLCQTEASRFTAGWEERDAAHVIHALRTRADGLRERQLTRALAKLGHLGSRDREVVAALAWGLTNALLHEPTVALRARPERAETARALFGLDEEAR